MWGIIYKKALTDWPPGLPHYFRCLDEDTWLSERRPLPTWMAAERLAVQLCPANRDLLTRIRRRHLADEGEVKAWTEAFFKFRDYTPPKPPVDLRPFYKGAGVIDTQALSRALRMDISEVVVMLRMLDKALMVAAVEEILQSVKHSREFSHKIELAKSRA